MKPLSIPCLLLVAGFATAQDMPLHEIIKPGEGWKPASGDMPARPSGGYTTDGRPHTVVLNGTPIKVAQEQPTACVVTLGGAQLLIADANDRYVWAFRIEKDGSLGAGDRYCRMRVLGDDRRKEITPPENYLADPTAMTADAADRTYVATNLGIQVFDPTGRLCGVFAAPKGRITELAFDGDRLFARADGRVYVRKMLAEGRK